MTWFKVDDNLTFHMKVVAAGNAAMGLWVRAGAWSAQQLTDGFVPDAIAATIGTRGEAKRLEAAGLWERRGAGWQFHEWEQANPSREEVEAARDRERTKKRRQRAAGARAVDHDPANGQFTSHHDDQGASPGDTDGASPATRPDPTRPMGESPLVSTTVPTPPGRGDRVEAVICELARRDVERHLAAGNRVAKPAGFERACRNSRRADCAPQLHELVRRHPDWSTTQLADHLDQAPGQGAPAGPPRLPDWTPTVVPDALPHDESAARVRQLRAIR